MADKMARTCKHCKEMFESKQPTDRCPDCAEKRADKTRPSITPPEGGWPRGSTMSQI